MTDNNGPQITDVVIAQFEKRGVDPEIAVTLGIYTGRWIKPVEDKDGKITTPGHIVRDGVKGDVLVFPIMDGDRVVNEKYRGKGKRFWQWNREKSRATFVNADILDDPALYEVGGPPLIITEGEIDMLTGLSHGFPYCVSVPDGAPPAPKGGTRVEDFDPEQEATGKFAFLFNNADRLKKIKRFIIAVDDDEVGHNLRDALVLRLGAARCMTVHSYGKGCKDLNETWVESEKVNPGSGTAAVKAVLDNAPLVPIKGIFKLSDFPDRDIPKLCSTGWSNLDDHLKLWRGQFIVLLGIPGHGKTTFTNNLIVRMASDHNWVIGDASFEESVKPYRRNELRRLRIARIGGKDRHMSVEKKNALADDWIEDHFRFLINDVNENDEIKFEDIIEMATQCVMRDNIDMLVIDPWNEIDHMRRQGEHETEYTGRAIKALKRFAKARNVCVLVVVHPAKPQSKAANGQLQRPTPYDASGSAHWYNKAEHYLIFWRPEKTKDLSELWIEKSKFRFGGTSGVVEFSYDRGTSELVPVLMQDTPDDGPQSLLEM